MTFMLPNFIVLFLPLLALLLGNMLQLKYSWKLKKTLVFLSFGTSYIISCFCNFIDFLSQPSAARSYFPESYWWPQLSSLSKLVLVLGKARSDRAPNLGCRGAESPRWLDVSPKYSARDMMHEWTHCHHQTANHLWPTTAAFWIMWIVSMEKFSNLTQNLMQICCSTCSVILNVMTTVHMLTQQHPPPPLTSVAKSLLFMHVHSSPLSLAATLHQCCINHSRYINNGWTFSGQTSYILKTLQFKSHPILSALNVRLTSPMVSKIIAY